MWAVTQAFMDVTSAVDRDHDFINLGKIVYTLLHNTKPRVETPEKFKEWIFVAIQ